jgi:hypothetical protein
MAAMTAKPTGAVTFLFTDIEGSTKLWERLPDAMRVALARHDAIMRATISENGGVVFKTIGDAFCAAFQPGVFRLRRFGHLFVGVLGRRDGSARLADGPESPRSVITPSRWRGARRGPKTSAEIPLYPMRLVLD